MSFCRRTRSVSGIGSRRRSSSCSSRRRLFGGGSRRFNGCNSNSGMRNTSQCGQTNSTGRTNSCNSSTAVKDTNRSTDSQNSPRADVLKPQDQTSFSKELTEEKTQNGGKIHEVSQTNEAEKGGEANKAGNDHAKKVSDAWQSAMKQHTETQKGNTSADSSQQVKPAVEGGKTAGLQNRQKEIDSLKKDVSNMKNVMNMLESSRGRMSGQRFNEMKQEAQRIVGELEKRAGKLNGGRGTDGENRNNNTNENNRVNNNRPNNEGERVNSNRTNTDDRKPDDVNANKTNRTNNGGIEDYESKVNFTNFPEQKKFSNSRLGNVLPDIESHLPRQYGSTYREPDHVTWAHETTHGINSHLRNNYNNTGKEANGFYVGNDRGVVMAEPNMRKSQVAEHVPQSLRGNKYDMYIRGQGAWDKQPLYIMDEWNAYTNGGKAAVDMAKQGKFTQQRQDAVSGQLEFTAYSFALGKAIEKNDPNYFKNNPQFKNFLGWYGLQSMDTFREGASMPQFQNSHQAQYLKNLQSSPDAAPLRDFIQRNYGEAYLQRLLYGQ